MTTALPLRATWVRHVIVGSAALLLTYGFWLSRPQWVADMRLWRAVGDASLLLLYVTLAAGPLARLLPRLARLLPYRRETGIWFGLLALAHTLLILNGWARWNIKLFLGYEFVPEVGRFLRLESGFGMANLLGLAAVVLTVPLMVTSADWAVRVLGGSAWKFLHYSSYTIFWLAVLHTAYFLFIHYTPHFHRRPPPDPNWFRWPFVVLTLAVAVLQVAAFLRTVLRQKRQAASRGTTPAHRRAFDAQRGRAVQKAR